MSRRTSTDEKVKKKKRDFFRFSVLSNSSFSSWRRSSTSGGSISQSRASSATTSSIFTPAFPLNHNISHHHSASTTSQNNQNNGPLPSTSSYEPPASAPARIPIVHNLVKSKSKFRQCDVCERFFIFDFVRRQHLDDVYACNVCGPPESPKLVICRIRVHEGCMRKLGDDCVMTPHMMGGLLHNAVMASNKKLWEDAPTPAPTPPASAKVMVTSPTDSSLATIGLSPSIDFEKNVPTATSSYNNTPLMTMTASSFDDVTLQSEQDVYDNADYERELTQWRDITIQLSDVHVKGRIGDGRFGTVHLAEYHGDVAVKFVNMNYLKTERSRLEVFTQEIVTAYKNSRHDHIALFLGYVVDLPTNTYAIVTNFYQHKTLYHRIHDDQTEDYEQPWAFQISLQICQAMSYLHRRKILHRDLRSKNILLDNPNRVVVADFALMKWERLALPKRDYTLIVPNHWLDYLAPEVASSLMLDWRREFWFDGELPFTGESDVYSFGTIFYELLFRKMPTGVDSWEQKLYAKMTGQKASLQRSDSQLQKIDTKLNELLLSCWSAVPEKRPSFAFIVKRITSMMPRNKDSSNKQKRRSTAHENPLF